MTDSAFSTKWRSLYQNSRGRAAADEFTQIFYYDLATGSRTDLFLDAWNITFHMVEVTEDSYIGVMYQEIWGNMVGSMYQIPRADFEAGNPDAAKKLPVNVL